MILLAAIDHLKRRGYSVDTGESFRVNGPGLPQGGTVFTADQLIEFAVEVIR
jgi:hypothetical protein